MPAGLPAPVHHAIPLCLADAVGDSLANVETVRANVAVRRPRSPSSMRSRSLCPGDHAASHGRLQPIHPGQGHEHDFPDVTGGTPLVGLPG